MSHTIEPYQISVPDAKLQSLKQKLEHAEFPDELDLLDDARWELGSPLADVKRLVAHWKDRYDWRRQEANINALPNFRTTVQVDGFEPLDIHFLHQKSEVAGARAIPLLFSHGWPGNFLEVTRILPFLTNGGKDHPSFHVVAPSLPNFAFSSGTKRRGFALKQYAETFHQLMLRLGYDEYVVQGGDWGSMISRTLTRLFPSSVKACHLNLVRSSPPTLISHPFLYLTHLLTPYSSFEREGRARSAWSVKNGIGYRSQQNTKPQTLGYGLADSPVGLLAWIYEKLHDWTDRRDATRAPEGGEAAAAAAPFRWTDDEIITWVSLYWFSTAGPAASLRIYYESFQDEGPFNRMRREGYVPGVKLGLSYFPMELAVPPLSWGRTMGPVVFEGVHTRGGHFAAWEQPQALAGDLRAMFGKQGGAYGAVKGKDGFASE